MTIAGLGAMGQAGTPGAASLAMTCTTAGALAGSLVLCCVGKTANVTTDGPSYEVLTVTDSSSNTWTKLYEYSNASTANASLWMSVLTTAIPITTGTILATFDAGATQQSMGAANYSLTRGLDWGVDRVVGLTLPTNLRFAYEKNTGAKTLIMSRQSAEEHLYVRFSAGFNKTVTAGWTLDCTRGTNMSLHMERLISTATTATSLPTGGGNVSAASVLIAFTPKLTDAVFYGSAI